MSVWSPPLAEVRGKIGMEFPNKMRVSCLLIARRRPLLCIILIDGKSTLTCVRSTEYIANLYFDGPPCPARENIATCTAQNKLLQTIGATAYLVLCTEYGLGHLESLPSNQALKVTRVPTSGGYDPFPGRCKRLNVRIFLGLEWETRPRLAAAWRTMSSWGKRESWLPPVI